jgi:hypothetical protein
MTHQQPRTRFNSPRLVRMLSAMGAPASSANTVERASFAERIGRWIALTDAIVLGRVLTKPIRESAVSVEALPAIEAALHALKARLARLRDALPGAQTGGGSVLHGRIRLPTPPSGVDGEDSIDFTPYRHYYLAQQREMEANVGQLRTAAHDALQHLTPAAQALQELDAALQAALAERERSLLAGIPRLLERRFEALRAAYRQQATGAPQADETSARIAPESWLNAFRSELLAVQEAELELRLQPVSGLMETLENEIAKRNRHTQ